MVLDGGQVLDQGGAVAAAAVRDGLFQAAGGWVLGPVQTVQGEQTIYYCERMWVSQV